MCHKAANGFGPMMRPMNDDPAGFYARLGVEPSATSETITAAFRRKARVFHPDVAATGNAEAFMRVKEAYDVLDDAERRAAYDRSARAAPMPEPIAASTVPPATRPPRLYNLPVALWAGVGGLFCLASIMTVVTLTRAPSPQRPAVARAFAPSVAPAEPDRTARMQAATSSTGTATHYVLPAGDATVLWRRDAEHDGYVPGGHLADFTAVQALRLVPRHGLVEIVTADGASGFVDAARLTSGDEFEAHRSYCTYNAGPPPENGAVIERHGSGESQLRIDNRGSQPTVVKLRDATGLVAVSVFLAPGGTAMVSDLPDASYRPEFAVGELWSRACHGFAAGMRAERFADFVPLSTLSPLAVPPAFTAVAPPQDIPDAAFEREQE
jgi:DnaJ domain